MKQYESFCQDCDLEIRAGHAQAAARKLAKINPARVPRPWRMPLAHLCRRAGLITLGLRLLADIAYPGRSRLKNSEPASAAELAEYAVLLHRCGANSEALKLLRTINPDEVPETLLYQAYCEFNDWNYHLAVEVIESYLRQSVPPYMQLVARVNLAAALVSLGRHEQALEVIEQNIELARHGSFLRLEANCYEMRARAQLNRREFSQARRDLVRAQGLLGDQDTHDSFLIRYHLAIITGLESGSAETIRKIQKEAHAQKEWEQVREAEQFALMVGFSEEKFNHLYFGSPFEPYRAILRKTFSRVPSANHYDLGRPGKLNLEIRTGKLRHASGLREDSMLNGKCLQLLGVLVRDFYKPLRLAGIFAQLFPHENFNLATSPGRIHQILFRIRQRAKDLGSPFSIAESDGFYAIRIERPFSFRVPLNDSPLDHRESQWSKIESHYDPLKIFTFKDVQEKLAMSESTAHRLLTWAVEMGKVERLGEFNSIRYRRKAAA